MNCKITAVLLSVMMILSCVNPFAFASEDIVMTKKTLLKDEFSDGISSWQQDKGAGFSFDKKAKNLHFKSLENSKEMGIITRGEIGWGDYIFTADVRVKSGDYVGLFFRYKDINTHYLLQFYGNGSKIMLLKRINGGEYVSVDESNFGIADNVKYTVCVKINGGNINVSIDEKTLINCTDTSIAEGKIGVKGQYSEFTVDNILVESETIDEEKSNVLSYSKEAKKIYVSPKGNDDNNGSKSSPLKSFDAAKSLANIKKIGSNPVEVLFMDGKYEIDETVTFTSNDSGSAGAPIVYKADEGATPVFTGSRALDVTQFKSVSDEVYKRLPASSAGKVKQIDLKSQGITQKMIDLETNRLEGKTGVMVNLYLNNARQSISRWPNTDYNIFAEGGLVNTGGLRRWGQGPDDGAVFKYEEINPSRWGELKNAYLVGYFGSEFWGEWAKIDKVDPEQTTISLSRWTQYGVKEGYRWAVTHLLDEIDIPGEWYIDYDTMVLYYYAPYELDPKKDVFEVPVLTDPFVKMDDTKYVVFNGLNFQKNRGSGIKLNGIKNVVIDSCTLSDISEYGIVADGSPAYTVVQNSDLYNIGDTAIWFTSGGDKATLTSGHNKIVNNHIYNGQRDGMTAEGSHVRVDNNTGMEIKNNLMHKSAGAMSGARGNENVFANNELWNVSRFTSDSTAVGVGRSWTDYTNYFNSNYIHDVGSPTYKGYYTVNGLFWDDTQSGQVARNNIIFMNNKNNTAAIRQGGGRDNIVEHNIIVGSDISINGENRTGSLDITTYDAYKQFIASDIDFTKSPWIDKYPKMSQIKGDIEKDGKFLPRNNVIANNVFADNNKTTISSAVSDNGRVENNLETKDLSIFVDAKNQDFRLTDEAKKKYSLAAELPGEDYNLDEIGLQRDVSIKKGEFRLLYPENGATNIETNKLELFWEEPVLADEYRYTIATDPEFSNIVDQGISLSPYIMPKGIENNKTYYWKINARYISKKNPSEWESLTKVSSFTTAVKNTIENEFLVRSIEDLKEKQNTIAESNSIGGYAVGTKAEFTKQIAAANVVLSNKGATQDDINKMTAENKKFLNSIGSRVNAGYKALKLGNDANWQMTDKSVTALKVADGMLTATKTAPGAEFMAIKDKMPNNEILCFDAKSDLKGWVGFSTRQSDKDIGYSHQSNEYLVIIKGDVFELQQYRKDQSVLGILETKPNNGIFKANEWNKIQFGSVDVEGGVQIVLKVNDKVIFEYIDSAKPIYDPGYFIITHYQQGSTVQLRETAEVPEGVYVKPKVAASTVYTTDSDNYKESKPWTVSENNGYNTLKMHTTETKGDKASWLLKGVGTKTYKVYYWNEPTVNTDLEVLVHLKNYNIEETLTINMADKPQGWVELGDYIFITASAAEGDLNVEFESSGKGKVGVSAMKIERVK